MIIDRLLSDLRFAEERAEILKALAHPVRLRLIARLALQTEETVGNLCEALDLPQAKVSQQLAALRLHHLVQLRKQNGYHFYSLATPRLIDLLDCLTKDCKVAPADS